MKSVNVEYEQLDDEHRFSRADFPLPPRSLFPSPSDSERKGLEFTSVKTGELFEDIAAEIIQKNYVDVWLLTNFFSIKMTTSQYGVGYEKGRPSETQMRRAYHALRVNTNIQKIHFDHLKHSKESIEELLQSIAANRRLPLRVLSLKSIFWKRRISKNPQDPQNENWMLALLVEYLPSILATRMFMSRLTLASNRLGLFASDDQLTTIGNAVSRCKCLHTLDLDNNKFSFQQAMLLMKIIHPNKSITTLKLSCQSKSKEEKIELNTAIAEFLKRNCDNRNALQNAIKIASLELVMQLCVDTDTVFYSIEGKTCVEYTNDLITEFRAEIAKLRSKLNSKIKWFANDDELTKLINSYELKIPELERISDYLKELRSSTLAANSEQSAMRQSK